MKDVKFHGALMGNWCHINIIHNNPYELRLRETIVFAPYRYSGAGVVVLNKIALSVLRKFGDENICEFFVDYKSFEIRANMREGHRVTLTLKEEHR